jgi:hypothetical protein
LEKTSLEIEYLRAILFRTIHIIKNAPCAVLDAGFAAADGGESGL